MTEYDSAEIYDHPIKYMSVRGIFRYINVDVIPFKGSTRKNVSENVGRPINSQYAVTFMLPEER